MESASEARTAVVGATSTALGAATGAVRLNAKRPPALPLPGAAVGDRIWALATSSSCSKLLTTCRKDLISMLLVVSAGHGGGSHLRVLLGAGHTVARAVSHRSRLSVTLQRLEQEN